MATFPAAIFEIIIGTKRGATLPGPLSKSFLHSLSTACNEPIPEPILTPTLYLSSFSKSNPAFSKASFEAATAY